MTQLEYFAKQIRFDMFASRDSVREAFDYAGDVIQALPQEVQIYAFTALHVVINSISDELLRINQNAIQSASDNGQRQLEDGADSSQHHCGADVSKQLSLEI